jgi:hypothetical protein
MQRLRLCSVSDAALMGMSLPLSCLLVAMDMDMDWIGWSSRVL